MRAVNLIPADSGRGGRREAFSVPAYAIIAVLGAALVLVTVYVLSSNTIVERQAKVTSLQAQAAQANTVAASLNKYTQFQQLAQARAETVRQIAVTRFDWHAALADLSKVVPANTSLQSLTATVAPGAGSGGAAGGGTSEIRSVIPSPAFEMTGCTANQDDVARLMSRLRLINGVTRVTLADSTKPTSGSGGAAATPTDANTGTAGCGANGPTFDLVIFFKALAGAPVAGATAAQAAATPAGTSTTPAGTSTTPTTTTATTPAAGASTTPTTGASTTPAATPPAGTTTSTGATR